MGQPLTGKTVLVYAEQGLGDTLQFSRFLPRIKALGATVVFECLPALVPLFRHQPAADVVVAAPDGARWQSKAEYQVSLLSLPHRLRITGETIPPPLTFINPPLPPQPWERLFDRPELKVGLV